LWSTGIACADVKLKEGLKFTEKEEFPEGGEEEKDFRKNE